jgi:hypothetical protein
VPSAFVGEGSGFRVQDSGFRIQSSGFGVQGSGFRVQGAGFRVWGSVFGVQGSGFGVQGLGFRAQGWFDPPRLNLLEVDALAHLRINEMAFKSQPPHKIFNLLFTITCPANRRHVLPSLGNSNFPCVLNRRRP